MAAYRATIPSKTCPSDPGRNDSSSPLHVFEDIAALHAAARAFSGQDVSTPQLLDARAARRQQRLLAEGCVTSLVCRKHQLDPQLRCRYFYRGVEAHDRRDGAHHLSAELQSRTNHGQIGIEVAVGVGPPKRMCLRPRHELEEPRIRGPSRFPTKTRHADTNHVLPILDQLAKRPRAEPGVYDR